MGIEGGAPTTVRVMCTAAVHGPTELLRKSVVAVSDDCYDSSSDAETDLHQLQLQQVDECALAADLRRRTSIPPTFAYGADISLDSADGADSRAESSTPAKALVEERRWRSFDCAASDASTTIAGRSLSMDLLDSRIQHESEQVSKCRAKLGRDRRLGWVRAVKGVFRSSSKKEQVALLQMHLVAEVAKGHRSLTILNDTKTLLRAMEDASSSDTEASRASAVSLADDPSTQKLLDGIENADQMLAEDNRHHILSLQSRWLQELVRLHADKSVSVTKPLGVAPSTVMQQFLSEFVRPDGSQRVPCAFDRPTIALVRFEKIVNKCKLIKPALKRALDQVCRDTMAAFTRVGGRGASVFDDRDARDVMQSLVREIVDAVAEEAWVADPLRPILTAFVEQMVYSRLACACYYAEATELDELNETWREQAAKMSGLGLHEVGLPATLTVAADAPTPLFAKSIVAFNAIPHVVPSCVLAAFLNAVRVLYREAHQTIGVAASAMSADVLLPLLVFVLSRSDLPHVHSQVYLMKEFAIDESQEGSEAAYYLACLQAAMGYIMTRDASVATA